MRLLQPAGGLRAAIDAVLLAAAVPARPGDAVLELGCGTGAAFLCLAARVPGLAVHALEGDAALVPLARRNAEAAGLDAVVEHADIRAPIEPRFRQAFANPPYWARGTASPHALRRSAAHEGEASLADWTQAMARGLRHRGGATLVLPAQRVAEAMAALRASGFGTVRLLPLWPRQGVAAKRVLLHAIKGGRGPDAVLPGLVLHQDAGFSAGAEAILRHAAALEWE
ncbi:tRNA1(Val) (adenine(37)-N6)-methyltransferase [Rhodovarius lipocyclicus]|uniref:tRNA1(Val) (adenine(37)-N6)-methyltransferase n=1 Tax=Rhodovarius lipocyclicus TaxID=268410 RepID=UPI001F41B2F8|nr:methyltransferase [Rhodovarius lipocyclicus]